MTRYSTATSLVPRLPIEPLPTPRIITTLPSWDGILNHSSGGGIRVDADGAATRGLMGVSGFGLGGHTTTGVLGVEVTATSTSAAKGSRLFDRNDVRGMVAE